MCGSLRVLPVWVEGECIVCLRRLHPTDNDRPFCSPTCRAIERETSVLVNPPTNTDPAQDCEGG